MCLRVISTSEKKIKKNGVACEIVEWKKSSFIGNRVVSSGKFELNKI